METVENADLAMLRARLAALDGAMASGVLTVEDADTGRLTYRNYPEMRQARVDLLARIKELDSSINGGRVPSRYRARRIFYSKGW